MPTDEGKQLRFGPAAHPGELELGRFMRGELTRMEERAVVRHLLTRCPHCSAVTRRFWSLGERSEALEALVREATAQAATTRRRRHG